MVNESKERGWHIYQDGVRNDDNLEEGFGGILDILMDNHIYSLASLDDTDGKKMFTSYLWPEFRNAVVLYVDNVSAPWEEIEEPSYEDIYDALQEEVTK